MRLNKISVKIMLTLLPTRIMMKRHSQAAAVHWQPLISASIPAPSCFCTPPQLQMMQSWMSFSPDGKVPAIPSSLWTN